MFHVNVVVVVVVVVIAAVLLLFAALSLASCGCGFVSDYRTCFVLLSFRRARDRERVGLF